MEAIGWQPARVAGAALIARSSFLNTNPQLLHTDPHVSEALIATMGLLDRVVTPRGKRGVGGGVGNSSFLPQLALPASGDFAQTDSPREALLTPRRTSAMRLGKLMSAAGRMLTPRGRREPAASAGPAGFASPRPGFSGDSMRTEAYRPSLTGLMEQQVRMSPALAGAGASPAPTPRRPVASDDDSSSDSSSNSDDSDAESDLSSLDGFGEYARGIGPIVPGGPLPSTPEEGEGSTGSAPSNPDQLP
jgi:hypothetical protein